MSSGELLSEGLALLILGMGTVFVFLTLLVIVTTLMSSLVMKYAPAAPAKGAAKVPALSLPPAAGAPAEQTLTAVISAAIHAHRKNNSR